jgi:hypothetical protein
VAHQRSLDSASGVHMALAADGTRWRWRPVQPGSEIKAIEMVSPRRLLVLERVRDRSAGAQRFFLRPVKLDRCDGDKPCNPAAWRIDDGSDAFAQLNFEGLACFKPRHCLLVSDSGAQGKRPTRLVHLHLSR